MLNLRHLIEIYFVSAKTVFRHSRQIGVTEPSERRFKRKTHFQPFNKKEEELLIKSAKVEGCSYNSATLEKQLTRHHGKQDANMKDLTRSKKGEKNEVKYSVEIRTGQKK